MKRISPAVVRFLVFFLAAQLMLAVIYEPYIHQQTAKPAETAYSMLHGLPIDYYMYLSVIEEGKSGALLYHPAYTTEQGLKPSIFYVPFIAAGYAARVFGLWPPVAYHVFKIAATEAYFLGLFLLAGAAVGPVVGFWGSLFALAASIPTAKTLGVPTMYPFGPWWLAFGAFERLDNLPHHILGQGMLFFLLYGVFRYRQTRKRRYAAVAIVATVVGGVAFPPILLVPALVLPGALIVSRMKRLFKRQHPYLPRRLTGVLITLAAIAGMIFLMMRWQEHQGFPWNQWTPWELARWNGEPNIVLNMLILYGILPAFALLLLFPGLGQGSFELSTLALWVLVPYLLIPASDALSLPKIRLIQAAPYVAMTLAFTYVAAKLTGLIRSRVLLSFVMVTVITGNLVIAWSHFRVKREWVRSDQSAFLPETMLDAFAFMDRSLPARTPILSYEYDGIAIPSFTREITYFGQMNHTLDFFRKKGEVTAFYDGSWSAAEAKAFLRKNHLEYVYFGRYERQIAGGDLTYPFLESIYTNSDVTVYKVR